jgi:hypothetical protein
MNTLENKAKFFAQYHLQKVLCVRIEDAEDKKGFEVNFTDWKTMHPDSYLELKPLSQISDEDAIEVAKMYTIERENFEVMKNSFGKVFVSWGDSYFEKLLIEDVITKSKTVDYLRSKGYALDWNGITVEKQISFGWIKND